MAGIYSPCPALRHGEGYLILRAINRRFHAFVCCRAALFPVENRQARAALAEANLVQTPAEFRDAVAYLSNTAVLTPFEGGAEVTLYLARPGKEEDFHDVAPDLEEGDLQRLASVPDVDKPLLVVFGDAGQVAALAAAPPEPEEEPAPEPEPVAEAAQAQPEEQAAEPTAEAPPPAEPTSEPVAAEPAPEPTAEPEAEAPPAPEPEPVPVAAEVAAPEAEAQTALEAPALEVVEAPPAEPPPAAPPPQPEPVAPPVAPPPAPVAEAVAPSAPPPTAPPPAPAERPTIEPPPAIVHAPVALQLGEAYYALRSADVEGSTVVVWQARRLAAAPSAGEYELLQPSAELRQRLIGEARNGARFGDEGVGELVAVKIALPGHEADLERSLEALRRLGNRALRLYYPGASAADGLWPAGFPCLVVEWAGGTKLSESPLFSETVGLEVCFQIADLLDSARQAAPDIVLTDSLKPDNVVFAYDDQARLRVRIIDWNVYGSGEELVRGTTLVRFGEIMTRVFAPDMPFAVNWAAGSVPLHRLAAGQPGDPGAAEWDALTYGTQTLIRRALQGDFEGDAGEILRGLRQSIKDQQARWAEDDPLWQARLETGPARLNWLDIAAARQGRLSAEARARLDEDRLAEIREIIAEHTNAGRHLEAVIDLRTALRRHPRESSFRWAMLAHTIGLAGPELTFRRLHLDEALTHLQGGRLAQAQNALERGAALFDDLGFEPEPAAEVRKYMEALLLNAEALALAESAANRLAEDWRVEDAESRLALAEDLAGRSESLSRSLLAGRDAVGQQKLADLRAAIAAFHEKHRGYDPTSQKREAAEQARQLNFGRLVERARAMAGREQPDAWAAAQQLYERAADEYPDLWGADSDGERNALVEKIARRKLDDARRAVAQSNWEAASVALAHATLCPATRDDALRLQAAVSAFQRGEVEMRQGDAAAAFASFTFAANNSAELQSRAEARAAEAKKAGGAAEARGQPQAATAASLEGLADELRRQLTEISLALNGMMEEALTQVQENSAQQSTFLKQSQEEQWTRQQTALRVLQEEQASRLQSLLGQMPADQIRQQQALLKKMQEDQLAELKATLIQLYDEQSGWQQQTLKQLQAEQSEQRAQYQADLKKVQDEQTTRLQAAVQKLQEDFLSRQQAALTHLQDELTDRLMAREKREQEQPKPPPPPTSGGGAGGEDVDELKAELQRQAASQATLVNRTSRLMTVNVVLVLLLALAVCLGAVSFGWPLITRLRSTPVAEVDASPTAPSPLRSTTEVNNVVDEPTVEAPPTVMPATPEPTAPADAAGLQCSGGATFNGFYDCLVTNPGSDADELSLFVQAAGGQANGFSPSVMIDDEGNFLPDSTTGLVPLGDFRADETRPVRLILSCLAATGCPSTTFVLSLWTNRGTQQAPGSELRLTAEFPTANQ